MRVECRVQLKKWKRWKDSMLMLVLNETIGQFLSVLSLDR